MSSSCALGTITGSRFNHINDVYLVCASGKWHACTGNSVHTYCGINVMAVINDHQEQMIQPEAEAHTDGGSRTKLLRKWLNPRSNVPEIQQLRSNIVSNSPGSLEASNPRVYSSTNIVLNHHILLGSSSLTKIWVSNALYICSCRWGRKPSFASTYEQLKMMPKAPWWNTGSFHKLADETSEQAKLITVPVNPMSFHFPFLFF